jgi:hypothetical protein
MKTYNIFYQQQEGIREENGILSVKSEEGSDLVVIDLNLPVLQLRNTPHQLVAGLFLSFSEPKHCSTKK